MKRILAALGITSLVLLGAPAAATAVPAESHGGDGKMITICHATGSETNPYVEITISLNGLHGHGNDKHQLEEDIIPPNTGNIVPGGQNWTADGRAIWDNGCVANGNGNNNGDHKKITICHATGSSTNPYVVITISLNGLNGHVGHQHDEDIIPPNDGTILPGGQNWTAEGQAIFNNDCVPVEPVIPLVPQLNPDVPDKPRGAVAGPAVGGAAVATNPGFDVQTAVADPAGIAVAPWVGGLAALLLAGIVIAVRRTLADGGRP